MNRVSSRQRLVSWDAFDATAPDGNSSSDEEVLSEYETCVDDSAMMMMMLSPSSSWTTVVGGMTDTSSPRSNSETTTTAMTTTVGGHKRDRAARRGGGDGDGNSSSSKLERSLLSQLRGPLPLQEPNTAAAAADTTALESHTTAISNPLQLQGLAVDAQLSILSFLDLPALRSVMATCHTFRKLLMSEAAHFVWVDWIQHVWPRLKFMTGPEPGQALLQPITSSNIQVMDSMRLPTAAGNFDQQEANLALLLSLAEARHSSIIDADLFRPPPIYNLRYLSRRQNARHVNNMASEPQFVMYNRQTPPNPNINQTFTMSIVQFRGLVGTGDRCIRAKEPLARPSRRVACRTAPPMDYYHYEYDATPRSNARYFLRGLPLTTHHDDYFYYNHRNAPQRTEEQQQYLPQPPTTHGRMSLLDFMCRGAKAVSVVDSHQHPYWHWKPFVTPHVTFHPHDGKLVLDMTPRLISYFEVSILNETMAPASDDGDDDHDDDDESDHFRLRPPRSSHDDDNLHPFDHYSSTECVAVGVASHYFDIHSRMPGWDSFSFGYHGDDGGIFHASGEMLRPYGPRFGVGDTVGCGIDYSNGGIFFTLNSKFLGYAWTGLSTSLYLQQDLYPVVGVDSKAPISCNFGERPFTYDISSFLRQRAHAVKDACGWGHYLTTPTSTMSTTETSATTTAEPTRTTTAAGAARQSRRRL